jgi:hypothetical protein
MAHYKPKTASPIYSQARLILLSNPNLKYKEVFDKMTTPCGRGSIDAYGASIRHEIGCELRTVDGHERLEVNYDKYTAACKRYGVPALTVKTLLKTRTKSRDVVVNEQLPAPPAEIVVPETVLVTETFNLGGDIKAKKERINKAFLEAEIKMGLASHETIHLEAERKELMAKVAEIDAKIAKHRQEIDEAQQAMDVLLTLVDAPDSVIDMVL